MSQQRDRLRVAVAGGGICGALLATILRRQGGHELWDVKCYEKTPQTGGPPGVNLLLNHNGIATLKEFDEPLCRALSEVGFCVREWAARDMAGNVLYSEDVVESGLADHPGLRARWDLFVAAIREEAAEECDDAIFFDATVESYRYSGDEVVVTLSRRDGTHEEVTVDLLIAADGRFSRLRAQTEPDGVLPTPDVMDVANFKFLVPDTTGGLIDDYLRVYNVPMPAGALATAGFPHLQEGADGAADGADGFCAECMRGLARLGVMRMKDASGDVVGIYGNVRIARGGAVPACATTPDAMRALFTPSPGGEAALDSLGRFVLDALVTKAESGDFHWERFQEAPPRMRDEGGRVLLVGDAAHAFCPSLGQGASVAIEDACAAGALLREGARRGAPVTQMVDAVVTLRLPRVREIARTSRHHAIHLAAHEGQQAALDAEVADWTGAEGGTMAPGEWRRALESMWKGYPRVSDVVAHVAPRS